MTVFFSRVTGKGHVTIPKTVRERLGISTGSTVSFVVETDGTVTLSVPQYPTIASLAGAAGSLSQARSRDEMRDIAREDQAKQK